MERADLIQQGIGPAEALLRQALEALESGADTLLGRNAAAAIRERLSEGAHQ